MDSSLFVKHLLGSAHGQFCATKNARAFYLQLTWQYGQIKFRCFGKINFIFHYGLVRQPPDYIIHMAH